MSDATDRSGLQPLIEPWDIGWLDVGEGHLMRYLQSGKPDGIPVVLLHGGPASGSSPHHARFFDPDRYRIVQFDQRGSGQSTPMGERLHNRTDALIGDMEQLREHLGIDRWLVMGGSWGSALALAYGARHSSACLGFLLRGVFLASEADLDWYFHEMRQFLPQAWTAFARAVAVDTSFSGDGLVFSTAPGDDGAGETGSSRFCTSRLITAYQQALEDVNSEEAQSATKAFMRWEQALGSALAPVATGQNPTAVPEPTREHRQKYRLQLHYLAHRCFVAPGRILDSARRLSTHALPVAIVHGRRDCICRPGNAWQVFQAIDGSRLQLIDNTGHDPFSPDMVEATIAATRSFAAHGDFRDWASELRED